MSISMMDGAYFVGRVELLNWINDFLGLEYTKIEQTCSGSAACQIIDALYPGKVPLRKVIFNAKHEYEYINNFKILQKVFDELHIDKRIDIEKLVKGKSQDNLEFIQWLKAYYDRNSKGEAYNAVEKRNAAIAAQTKPKTPVVTTAKKPTSLPSARDKQTKTGPSTPAKTATKDGSRPSSSLSNSTPKSTPSKDSNPEVAELKQLNTTLKVAIEDLEKERDFYFTKLRDIEIYCQGQDQENEFVQHVLKILYATDQNQEFVTEEDTN